MTKTTLFTAVSLAALLPFLSACADPSRLDDAEKLRDRLAALPAVTKATLDYTEPIVLDSGKVMLSVEMAPDASSDQVTEVVTTTYAAFADVHHREEGDLDVLLGEDVIHLRSFEPDAEAGDVAKAAADAVAVLPAGTVQADIDTQDAPGRWRVFTTYSVSIDEPGPESVPAALADLQLKHGDIANAAWRVQAGGEYGWLLAADEGFPEPSVTALYEELRTDLPDGATIQLYGDDFAVVQVPADITPETASALAARHIALLGGIERAWYHLESGPEFHLMVAAGDCTFDPGPVGTRLEKELAPDCSTVQSATE